MLSQEEIYRFLAGVVGEDDVTVNAADLYAYSMDASLRMSLPTAVARPESREEVVEILKRISEGSGNDRSKIYDEPGSRYGG